MVICQSVHPHMSLGTCDRLLSLLNDGGRIQQKWVHAQSFSDSVHCVKNAAAYCLASILLFVTAAITRLTCAVSDLHPLLPARSYTLLANAEISSIFRSSWSVFWV